MPRTMGTSASRPATPKTRRAIPPPATMMTHTGRSRVPIPSSSGAPPTSHHPVSLAVKLVVFLVSSPLITYHPVSLAVKLVVFLVSSPITPSLWLSSLSSSSLSHPLSLLSVRLSSTLLFSNLVQYFHCLFFSSFVSLSLLCLLISFTPVFTVSPLSLLHLSPPDSSL